MVTNHIENDFESVYVRLRKDEGRIYTDEQVRQLPAIEATHPYFKEWQMREQSTVRLLRYLKKKQKPLAILEVGCGNGWLSHQLSCLPGTKVIGTDVNLLEIKQAVKAFEKQDNLFFMYGDISKDLFEPQQFDLILFAASIQYFPSLPDLIKKISGLLKPGGEIHLMDSPFYPASGLEAAKQRSVAYYKGKGYPEMATHYFQHSLNSLDEFSYSILYHPRGLLNRLQKNRNPFYWICVNQ